MNGRRCRTILLVTSLFSLGAADTAKPQQDPLPPPDPAPQPQSPAPHESIEAAQQLVDALHAQDLLNRGQRRSLQVKLQAARERLWGADADAAIRRLRAYVEEVDALGKGRVLSPKDAVALTGLGEQAAVAIGAIAFAIPDVAAPVEPACGVPAPCPEPLVLHVDGRSSRLPPDGSPERPFATVAAAQAAAAKAGACGVELRLARGTYPEGLSVDRPTVVAGDGSDSTVLRGPIIDEGGHDVEVGDLTLASSPEPGGVVVRTCPARVELSRVLIDGATRNGVRQHGGALRMFAVQVRGTLPLPDEVYSGSGVRLTGGVRAVVGLSTIDGSGSVGLSIADPGTRVYVAASLISDSRVNPAFVDGVPAADPGYGGVEVRGGALAFLELTTIRDNEAYGLVAREAGRVHFRYGPVESTRLWRPAGSGRWSTHYAGINIFVRTDGVVHTTEFVTTRAESAGYYVSDGFGTAFRGIVSHNPIGTVFRGESPPSDPTYDLLTAIRCVCNALRSVNNGALIEVPNPADIIGAVDCAFSPPVAPCRQVPPVCDWCAP